MGFPREKMERKTGSEMEKVYTEYYDNKRYLRKGDLDERVVED